MWFLATKTWKRIGQKLVYILGLTSYQKKINGSEVLNVTRTYFYQLDLGRQDTLVTRLRNRYQVD